MRPAQFFVNSSAIVFAAVMAGCAANLPDGIGSAPATVQAKAVSQSKARDLVFKYRQQASDLRELARRQEAEAQWSTGHVGQTDEQVRASRERARQWWAAAEEAEQLAHDYRRQVPHGQVN